MTLDGYLVFKQLIWSAKLEKCHYKVLWKLCTKEKREWKWKKDTETKYRRWNVSSRDMRASIDGRVCMHISTLIYVYNYVTHIYVCYCLNKRKYHFAPIATLTVWVTWSQSLLDTLRHFATVVNYLLTDYTVRFERDLSISHSVSHNFKAEWTLGTAKSSKWNKSCIGIVRTHCSYRLVKYKL